MESKKMGRPIGTGKDGVIRFLSEDEIKTFRAASKKKGKKWDLLFSLTLYFGLRVHEISNLTLSNFDFTSRQVTIKGGKRGLQRAYEMPDELWHKLKMWLRVRKAHAQNPYLFPHKWLETKPMSHIGIQLMFKEVCQKAGLQGHSIHDLRHTCGRLLALQNFSSFRISQWLRQRRATSAEVYVNLIGDRAIDEKAKEIFKDLI